MVRISGVFAALLLTAGAAAQGWVTTTYYADEITDRPAQLVISPNYLTLLEMPAPVDRITSARGDLMQLEVYDHQVFIRALRPAGTTDLWVTAGGRTTIFSVEVDAAGRTPHRYRVEWSRPQPPREARGAPEPRPAVQRAPEPSPAWTAGPPEGFRAEVRAERAGDTLVVRFELENQSAVAIATDAAKITLTDASGRPLTFTLDRQSTGPYLSFLEPGQRQTGLLFVKQPFTRPSPSAGRSSPSGGRAAST